jgi:hypothetical protein
LSFRLALLRPASDAASRAVQQQPIPAGPVLATPTEKATRSTAVLWRGTGTALWSCSLPAARRLLLCSVQRPTPRGARGRRQPHNQASRFCGDKAHHTQYLPSMIHPSAGRSRRNARSVQWSRHQKDPSNSNGFGRQTRADSVARTACTSPARPHRVESRRVSTPRAPPPKEPGKGWCPPATAPAGRSWSRPGVGFCVS